MAPSGSGVRNQFRRRPEAARATDAAPRATDPSAVPTGSFTEGSRGLGSRPSSPSRVRQRIQRTGLCGPAKAPPIRVDEPRAWFGWAEVRGATLDRWGSTNAVPGTNVLYGNQVNLLAGLTRKFTPNFLIGVLGGYETFDYRSDALQGRLKGDGWTVGSYLGWMIAQNVRFDAGSPIRALDITVRRGWRRDRSAARAGCSRAADRHLQHPWPADRAVGACLRLVGA